MDAVVFLEQVKKLDKMIENKLTDVALLKRKAEGLSGGSDDVVVYKNGKKELHRMDKVKTSKDNQPMATIIAKFLDLEAEIDADIDKLIDKRKKVIKVI